MRENIISIQNVEKSFRGNMALKNVSIDFEKGKIHGLIGRNGSGKTVLFKCICGFMPYDSGTISIDGKVIGKDIDVPTNIGIIIEEPGFLSNYSGLRNLMILASIQKKISKHEVRIIMEKVGLDPDNKKSVGKYSMGMRQRLGIAQSIMENPDILILDEPMNGLDKNGVKEVRALLLNLSKNGQTILLASHNAEDIDVLCDTVCEMDGGELSLIRNSKSSVSTTV